MSIACIVFTEEGERLARGIAAKAEGLAIEVSRGFGPGKAELAAWTEEAWRGADALLFVGAAGIAVRAIAPHVSDKATDPAVVVMDEAGRWAVPILSGHLGGANALALRLAGLSGAQAVVTTGSDVRGSWAVDEWAARRGLVLEDAKGVKAVSAALLAGREVALYADCDLSGALPEGVVLVADAEEADVVVTWRRSLGRREALRVFVPCLVAGVGCRRGASAEAIEEAFEAALARVRADARSVREVVSIEAKAGEEGLLSFCGAQGLPFATRSAEELSRVEGSVSPSSFVEETVGVDNVCERAALSTGGELLLPKLACGGVTVALSLEPSCVDFGSGE